MKTLAETLGETSHISPLARKLRRLGFSSLSDLKQLAVQRGCEHYRTDRDLVRDPGANEITNEELVVGLLLGEQVYDPFAIRIAGQLLSAVENFDLLADLSLRERVTARIYTIAQKGKEVEPENPHWDFLSRKFPGKPSPEGIMPHADRFTTEEVRKKMDFQRKRQWLRVIS